MIAIDGKREIVKVHGSGDVIFAELLSLTKFVIESIREKNPQSATDMGNIIIDQILHDFDGEFSRVTSLS